MNRIDIDLIAREVLAVLKERAEIFPVETGEAPKNERISNPEKPGDRDPASLRIVGTRVVTLENLAGRLDGTNRIIVAKNAVLTPSARDELRKRRIEIVRCSDTTSPVSNAGPQTKSTATPERHRPLRLLLQKPVVEPATLERVLRRDMALDVLTLDTAEAVVRNVLDHLPQKRNVALTGEPARLLCLANREPELWAVAAWEPKQVAADTRAVAANLLVIDPGRFVPFRMAETVRAFAENTVKNATE